MKVLVLLGGDSDERVVSLRSGKSVGEALQRAGYEVLYFDPRNSTGLEQAVMECDMVFPILHGLHGEDGTIQKQLDAFGKPYLGADAAASTTAFYKDKTKEVLTTHGIRMPHGEIVNRDSFLASPLILQPYVLKPVDGGSSVDTLIVRHMPDSADIKNALALFTRHRSMLLEECISGIELTVPIIGERMLPVIAIIPPDGEEFTFENKYNGKTQEICPVPASLVSADSQKQAQELALEVHRLLNIRHLSRTDIILTPDGEFVVLELNTLPGMTDQSLLPRSAKVAGITMPELVTELAELVLNK